MELNNNKYSENVDDILTKMPNILIRLGIGVIFLIFFVIIVFTYFIKYPEVISGDVIITTNIPPVKLSASNNGIIKEIYVENGEKVFEGDLLLEFRNTSSLEEINTLKAILNDLESDLNTDEIKYDYELQNLILEGNHEVLYELNRLIHETYQLRKSNDFSNEINLINQRIKLKSEYASVLSNLQLTAKNKHKKEKDEYIVQKRLFEENIISKSQYLQEEIKYFNKVEALSENEKALIQNRLSIHEDRILSHNLKRDSANLYLNKQEQIKQSILNLRSYIKNWYQKYTITAPKTGHINYLKNFYSKEYISSGQDIFVINSSNTNPIVYCYLPANGYGKIQIDQKARIFIDNYPSQEYGYLVGTVKHISEFPTDDKYLTKIVVNNNMLTNINVNLSLISQATGKAEIVTEDLRLFDRIFNQLNNLKIQ